jgi:hypothetical protein
MRPPARLLLTGAALLVGISCSNDAAVAPRMSAPPDITGSPALAALALGANVDFVIPVAGGSVGLLGLYTLNFPAGSVCDPSAQDSQDGYASQSWDAPCTPASGDIAVHATLIWSNGRLSADFVPALRFVPGQVVTMSSSLYAPLVQYYGNSAFSNGVAKRWGIGYAPYIGAPGIVDSKADNSLKTHINSQTGIVWRRIKHFSGYFMYGIAATPCDPSDGDPNCIWYDVDPGP